MESEWAETVCLGSKEIWKRLIDRKEQKNLNYGIEGIRNSLPGIQINRKTSNWLKEVKKTLSRIEKSQKMLKGIKIPQTIWSWWKKLQIKRVENFESNNETIEKCWLEFKEAEKLLIGSKDFEKLLSRIERNQKT